MSRILLVDDSPHAQRMGERILADEGYEVVTVSNADSALIRLDDADPDVVIADTVMPGRTGFDICHYLKMSPRHRHVRVILTAGVLEALDEEQAKRVSADDTLKKPFEASALLAAVKPLAEQAVTERKRAEQTQGPGQRSHGAGTPSPPAPFVAVVDAEQIRAAVTVALDAAMGTIVDEVSRRVLNALSVKKPDAQIAEPPAVPPPAILRPEQPLPTVPPATAPSTEPVRRVSPVRIRSSSILGLNFGRPEPPAGPPPDRE
jgi:CheY-like chemotaxis protein